jgi:hypothetical protein
MNEVTIDKKEWYKKWYVIVLVVIGFVWAVGSSFGGNSTSTTTQTKIEDRKTTSIVFAEKIIKDTLKSPATAKFTDVQAYELSNEKDVWAINGSVDSQNSFGAIIRNTWEVQLDYRDGKGGTVKSVMFDGKKVQ